MLKAICSANLKWRSTGFCNSREQAEIMHYGMRREMWTSSQKISLPATKWTLRQWAKQYKTYCSRLHPLIVGWSMLTIRSKVLKITLGGVSSALWQQALRKEPITFWSSEYPFQAQETLLNLQALPKRALWTCIMRQTQWLTLYITLTLALVGSSRPMEETIMAHGAQTVFHLAWRQLKERASIKDGQLFGPWKVTRILYADNLELWC